MSTYSIITITLFTSSTLAIFSNSWVTLWVLLEINTIAFCSITFMNSNPSEANNNNEVIINYLIIQSVASALLLIPAISLNEINPTTNITSMIIILPLMINIASAPLHQWFINLSNNIDWNYALILFTWQNLIPVYLVTYQLNPLTYIFITASAVLGSVSIINKTLLNEIFAFSSVFNLSWIILSISTSLNIFSTFTLIYWVSLVFVINLLNNNEINSINETTKSPLQNPIILIIIINMGGIPPMIGFLAKWLTFSSAIPTKITSMISILLISSTTNLFVYLRITSTITINPSSMNQNEANINSTCVTTTFLISNIILLSSAIL